MPPPGCEPVPSCAAGPGLVSVSPAGVARYGLARHGMVQLAQQGSAWRGMAQHGMFWHSVAQPCRSSHSGHAPAWSLLHQDSRISVPGSRTPLAQQVPNLCFMAAEITTFPPSSITAAPCHSLHPPKLTLDLSLLQMRTWMVRAAAPLCSRSQISGELGAF